jgi:dienelactone hydrolase
MIGFGRANFKAPDAASVALQHAETDCGSQASLTGASEIAQPSALLKLIESFMSSSFSRAALVAAAFWIAPVLAGAAHAAPAIEAYGKLPAAEQVTLSGSGERVAFVASVGQDRFVAAATTKGEGLLRVRVLAAEDKEKAGKVRDLMWVGEDHLLVFVTRTENLGMDYGFNHAFTRVLVLNVKTKKSFWVFSKSTRTTGGVYGLHGLSQKDGKWFAYFGGQPVDNGALQGRIDLFKVDLDGGDMTAVSHGSEKRDRSWLLAPDGTIVANSDYDDRTGVWRLFAGDDRDRLIVQQTDPFQTVGLQGFGRTADTLIYTTQDDSGEHHYMEAPLAGGAAQEILGDKKVNNLIFDRVTRLLIGAQLEGDEHETLLFPARPKAVWKGTKKAFPGVGVYNVSASDDFNTLIAYTDGKDDPGTYWLVNIKTGAADVFGIPYPEIKPADVGSTQIVDYKAADGLEMHGVLTLPPGHEAKNLPVVVMPHGGPASRDFLAFDWMAQAFASRGYAVFQPNFRGSTGYGADFENAGNGEWGRKMQTDISDGLASIAAKGIVDPKRACIVGASYGGYAALAGVTVQNGLYRCSVSYAGVSDLKEMLNSEAEDHKAVSSTVRYWKLVMGAKSINDGTLRTISPVQLADRADAPILLIHGKDDTTVPVEQSRRMERALKSAKKPVEYIELKGEDHYLSFEDSRIAMLKASVAFVEKHNPAN